MNKTYGFEITWGWMNDDRLFMFWWTVPLRISTITCFEWWWNAFKCKLITAASTCRHSVIQLNTLIQCFPTLFLEPHQQTHFQTFPNQNQFIIWFIETQKWMGQIREKSSIRKKKLFVTCCVFYSNLNVLDHCRSLESSTSGGGFRLITCLECSIKANTERFVLIVCLSAVVLASLDHVE